MSNVRLADLLGVKGNIIRWERPLLFCTALVISDRSWSLIPLIVDQIFPSKHGNSFGFSSIFGRPEWLLEELLLDLILAGLALIVFRLVSNVFLAIPIIAISSGFAHHLINQIVNIMAGRGESITLWWPRDLLELLILLLLTLWSAGLLTGVAVMVRLLKPLWLALPLGAITGVLISLALRIAIDWSQEHLLRTDPALHSQVVLTSLCDAFIFGVAFWAGLRISSDDPSLIAVSLGTRLARGFYLGMTASIQTLAGLLTIMIVGQSSLSSSASRHLAPSLLLLGITFLLAIVGAVVIMVLVYKMWAAIQDGHARTSPGRAVGLLFIPLANFIWMFQVFPGFAKDFNAFVKRHAFNVPLLPTGLFTAFCVLTLCAVIPFLGLLFFVIDYFVLLAMVSKICDAVNAIPESAVTATSVSPT